MRSDAGEFLGSRPAIGDDIARACAQVAAGCASVDKIAEIAAQCIDDKGRTIALCDASGLSGALFIAIRSFAIAWSSLVTSGA